MTAVTPPPATPEEAFRLKKQAAVSKAEMTLAKSAERLDKAMGEYDREVEAHKVRGDGFFSGQYVVARKAAVLARKHHESCESRLSTARAELAAPIISLPEVMAS